MQPYQASHTEDNDRHPIQVSRRNSRNKSARETPICNQCQSKHLRNGVDAILLKTTSIANYATE